MYVSNFVFTLSAMWTFDPLLFISPPLCISQSIEGVYLPFLELLAVLYPFLLLLLTYTVIELQAHNYRPVVVLLKPFRKVFVKIYRSWNPSSTMVQAFSSLFFLSYAKLTVIIWTPFALDGTYDTEFTAKRLRVVYADPNIPYMSGKHIMLISLSVFVAVFLYLPPILLLVVYPTSLYRKISHRIKPQWRIGIKTYVETFQGCLKDGTDGTWDYRAVPGYLLALLGFGTPLMEYIISTVPTSFSSSNTTVICYGIIAIFFTVAQPYKKRIANISAATTFIGATIFSSLYQTTPFSSIYTGSKVTLFILLLLPHCEFACYRLWKTITSLYSKWQRRGFCTVALE